MTPTPELIVTIERIADQQYLAKTLRGDGSEICRHTFERAKNLLVDLEPQWMLDKAVPREAAYDPLRSDGEQSEAQRKEIDKLAACGQRLYSLLFGDGRDLAAFLRFNDAYRQGCRLTLALHSNAAGLWRLPWEYLHDGEDFVALQGRFLLNRRPYGLGELDPPAAPLPLRILVLVSAPDDQRTLNIEKEILAIQEGLDKAVRAGRVLVEYLEEATLEAVGEALARFQPHVLHYTGHGFFDEERDRSFLALETEEGQTRPAGIADLRPHLRAAQNLHLVLLSGCQTAQTSAVDAFSGVATGLLDAGVPAVVAMQFSILDMSGIKLAEAFYRELARGGAVAEALQRSRIALWQFEAGPGYDWGVPALYLRARGGLRLVDATSQPPGVSKTLGGSRAALIDVGGLPLPLHFVGRKPELRRLRRALRERPVNAAYVRGIGGMGKSSLAAKLIQRPGCELDGVLVIRCHEVDPLDIPAKLASFLSGQGVAGHVEAGNLLLESRLDAAERARRAAALVAGRRYLIVFDNFESVLTLTPNPSPSEGEGDAGLPSRRRGEGPGVRGTVADENLRGLLHGLLDGQWRSTLLFTGRLRWSGLDERLGRGTAVELHLPALTRPQAIMLMNNLPRLRNQPQDAKIKLLRKVGGHPKSIELLEGWLAGGQISDLLNDPSLDGLLQAEWEDYFLRALLARLSADEVQALTGLSIFRTRLDEAQFDYAGVDRATVQRWLDLSLVQREQGQAAPLPPAMAALLDMLPAAERRRFEAPATTSIHPVVREYLLGRIDGEAQRELHLWAAAYHGRPFVDVARQMVRPGAKVTEEQIESFARGRDGVVGQMVNQTDDMTQARRAMARALEWQHHLLAAGAYEPAAEIVMAVVEVLNRWGQRDRAKALLRGSIATVAGGNKAVAQGNLATLLKNEGKLNQALATYEAVYRTFEGLNARPQMAAVLGQQSSVLMDMGRIAEAIAKQEASLEMTRQDGNEEGQAISLHQLSMLYRRAEDYEAALARSGEAEALARKLGNDHFLAATLHEQGLIYTRLAGVARAAEDPAQAANYNQAAFERFQESLAIKRRIGNEAGAADSLGELGKLLRDAGRMDAAIAAFTEFTETHRRLGNPVKVGIGLELLGSVHERQGQHPAALEKYREALGLFQRYSHAADVADTQRNIARVQGKL